MDWQKEQAGEIEGDSWLSQELMQLLLDQKYHWTEWHVSPGQRRRLLRQYGLQGLLNQDGNSSRSCKRFQHVVQRLVTLSLRKSRIPFRHFRSVEHAGIFKNLPNLYLSHFDNVGAVRSSPSCHPAPTDVQPVVPDRQALPFAISKSWSLKQSPPVHSKHPPRCHSSTRHSSAFNLIEHHVQARLHPLTPLPSMPLLVVWNLGACSIRSRICPRALPITRT